MSGETRIATSLRNAASPALSRAELDALRSKAWREHGLAVVYPNEVENDFVRQGLVNHLTKRFGRGAK